eukprot:Gb_37019 [translate_table: standard]
MSQLGSRDKAILVFIKNLEGLLQLLLRISILHLSCHQIQKLRKINCSVPISIHLINHILELCLCGVLSQRSHNSTQLLRCDAAIAIFVEKTESLLKLGNLLLVKLVCHTWI